MAHSDPRVFSVTFLLALLGVIIWGFEPFGLEHSLNIFCSVCAGGQEINLFIEATE